MKTLTSFSIAFCFLAQAAHSQFTENFNQNVTTMTSNCWQMNDMNYTTTSGEVISGAGSAYTNPSTNSSSPAVFSTPFLKMTSTSLNISFKYKLSNAINGQATKTMQIGIVDKNGVFTVLKTITLDRNTPTSVINENGTYTIATGVYRVEVRLFGDNGDGNTRVIFDDLSVSASAYYTGYCNPAAVAVNNSYSQSTMTGISGNVLTNDNIPADNDTYTAVLVSAPTQGTLVLNGNGTFTYTPAASFTGGTIMFSYKVVDNGYTAATSNVATVSLNYSVSAMLPIRLVSFTSVDEGSSVKLVWKAESNEAGEYFELEKGSDGVAFTSIKKMNAEHFHGVNEYSAVDQKMTADVYYRLKMVNNNGTSTYSKVIVIKTEKQALDLKIMNNPAISTLNINYEAPATQNNVLRVYSISGVKVYEQKINAAKGLNKVSIPVQSLQAGTYVLVLDASRSIKFVKG